MTILGVFTVYQLNRSEPDPSHLSVMVNKHNFLIHHMIDELFSSSPIKSTCVMWFFLEKIRFHRINLIT
jgi:hypothetical protein